MATTARRLEKLGTKVQQVVFKNMPQLETAAHRFEKQASMTLKIIVKPGKGADDPIIRIDPPKLVLPEESVDLKARWVNKQLELF